MKADRSLSRLPLLAALVATLILGAALTYATARLEDRAADARFDRLADLVVGSFQQRMTQHVALLRATRSYIEAENGAVSASEFSDYVSDLRLSENSAGIQGIGYAPLADAGAREIIAAQLSRQQGRTITLRPKTDQASLAPIAMLEPQDTRNSRALGFDMYAEPVRREAIAEALRTGEARASGPVELVQEITADKQVGFLIYLPTRQRLAGVEAARREAVVYAPFRAGDLNRAVLADLPALPLTVRVIDLGAPGTPLFDSATEPAPRHLAMRATVREVDVAGRRWQFTLTPTPQFLTIRDRSAAITVGALSLLLLGAVAVAMMNLRRLLEAAHRAAEMAERQAADRALLLREMQHRIKNHIARIQAISRQTARGAADLSEFERVFGGRLAAMAKAQDALGREGGERADLRALLHNELAQVLDTAVVDRILVGPPVSLGARETQAVSLVAHELMTNAMKYGAGPRGGRTAGDGLTISWKTTRVDGTPWILITWFEQAAMSPATTGQVIAPAPQPASAVNPGGFGSQLIEALIEGDLGGRFERTFAPEGMTVEIAFPLSDM